MKCKLKLPLPFVFAVLAMGFSAAPVHAQLTVFDPTSYTMLAKTWSEDISTGMKIAQTVQQGATLIQQGLQIYNLAMKEASYLEKGQVLQGIGFAAQHAQLEGHPEWDKAMTTVGGVAAAGVVWQNMTNPSLSMQNRIVLINSVGASVIQSLGNCNAAAQQNNSALGGLQSLVMSMGDTNNTAASQRSLANMIQQQALQYQQCQQNLAEQRAKLELIRAHESLDRDQATLNTNKTVDNYNAAGGGLWIINIEKAYRQAGMH